MCYDMAIKQHNLQLEMWGRVNKGLGRVWGGSGIGVRVAERNRKSEEMFVSADDSACYKQTMPMRCRCFKGGWGWRAEDIVNAICVLVYSTCTSMSSSSVSQRSFFSVTTQVMHALDCVSVSLCTCMSAISYA